MFKGWRTIIFNAIMLAAMFGAQAGWWTPEQGPSGEDVNKFLDSLEIVLTFVWGGGNVALRAITNTSIFSSK